MINTINKYIRRLFYPVTNDSLNQIEPISRDYGCSRGKPIDRVYIEHFIKENQRYIRGVGLEVGDTQYLSLYGSCDSKYVLRYQGSPEHGVLVLDLEDTSTIDEEIIDCFVATQVFNFTYDFIQAIKNSKRLLKPGGVMVGTVAALAQVSRYDADRWGDFWRFNPQGIKRALEDVYGTDNVTIDVYGNSLAATFLLKGVASEELMGRDVLFVRDEDYPVVIGFVARKR